MFLPGIYIGGLIILLSISLLSRNYNKTLHGPIFDFHGHIDSHSIDDKVDTVLSINFLFLWPITLLVQFICLLYCLISKKKTTRY